MVRDSLTNYLNIRMVSLNILLTEEALTEVSKTLSDKSYYLTPEGMIAYSVKTGVLEFVLAHATDDA